jgi:endonuclease/exonuclease/phosphatase family metal-dependent hydrolase
VPAAIPLPHAAHVTVMNYNLDDGSDLVPLLTATSPAQIPAAASAVLAQVAASDPAARARALADQIAAAGPALVGVEEASVWSVNGAVKYDLLQDMVNDLNAMGQHYAVVATAPAFGGTLPDAEGNYVSLQDRNAILARTDLPPGELSLSNVQSGDFATYASFPVGGAGGPVLPAPRSWLSVDVKVENATFRFVTTHLESNVPQVAQAQADELLAGPAHTTLPVVIAADMNSTPDTGTYHDVRAAGFQDTWAAKHPGNPGYTWGSEDISGQHLSLNQRIDYLFTSGGIKTTRVRRVGIEPSARTPDGLYPSDHAGLVATLELPASAPPGASA